MKRHVSRAAAEWLAARVALCDASAVPIGNDKFREALNRLSEAEDALAQAVREMQPLPETRRAQIHEILKASAGAVTAASIGSAIGICERSVYRHVAKLRAEGVRIAGEAGTGYMLKGARNGTQLHLEVSAEDNRQAGDSYPARRASDVMRVGS